MESCTGGLIASLITNYNGSSAIYAGGIVAYQNKLKEDFLGVDSSIITTFGVVSIPVAEAMALGCLKLFTSNYALATTGYANPLDDEGGKVCVAAASNSKVISHCYFFTGSRIDIKQAAAEAALTLLYQLL